MGYSNDLRVRVIRVVEGGVVARAAARQFVIGDATAIRWVKRWLAAGVGDSISRGLSGVIRRRRTHREQVRRNAYRCVGAAARNRQNNCVHLPCYGRLSPRACVG